MKWKNHITNISLKISRNIGIISRIKYFLSSRELLLLYNSLVLPYINYCAVVWGRNSILEADLLCTKYLYDNSSTWEAFVNVAGSDYPLTTNEDLVKQFLHSKTTLETGVTLERTVMADWLYDQRLTHLASNNSCIQIQG